MSRAPILDPSFRYHGAATHDADPQEFRRRMRQRMREAQANAAEAVAKVAPIASKRKTRA